MANLLHRLHIYRETGVVARSSALMIEAARPIKVDLDWLRNELAGLRDIRQLAGSAYMRP
jgi:hypothetical protein